MLTSMAVGVAVTADEVGVSDGAGVDCRTTMVGCTVLVGDGVIDTGAVGIGVGVYCMLAIAEGVATTTGNIVGVATGVGEFD